MAAISFAEEQRAQAQIAATQVKHDLSGSWILRVENDKHVIVTTMIVQFTNDVARSCVTGNWKRLAVISQSSTDAGFFPSTEELSYELTNDSIVIGRNLVCDSYLRLSGDLSGANSYGEYYHLGLGGVKTLGYFSLTRTS